jgi:hypothetical protein
MLPSVEATQGNNPGSEPFLDFLARDMTNHPERLPGLPQNVPERLSARPTGRGLGPSAGGGSAPATSLNRQPVNFDDIRFN